MILRLIQVPADAEEAALWWCARRQLRILSPRDEHLFEQWLREPGNAEAWDELNAPLASFSDFGTMPEVRAIRAKALSSTAEQNKRGGRWWIGGAIAASLAGALFLATESLLPFGEPETIQSDRYSSALGERRGIKLSDGSLVTLDTASTIETAYSQATREVRLLDGQARFDVAPNKARPFMVIAGDRRIIAVGTKFDVELGDNGSVKVVLIKGRVNIEPIRQTGLKRLLPNLSADELNPGEQLVSKDAGQVSIASADLEKETSWQSGQLVFRNDRLADAVSEMNRYSEAKIVLVDPTIEDLRISGVFRTDRQENFLAALTAFYPVEASRQAGMITLKWRNESGRPATAKAM